MPSLWDLLHDVRCDSGVTLSAYALFKGLVDVVKPEIDVAAEGELAEAKAEIERQASRLDKLYAEAANLQIQLNGERCDRAELFQQLAETRMELQSYTESYAESVSVDAEIGRLVRGMADRTRLIRGHPSNSACQTQMCYWAERQGKRPWLDGSWSKVGHKYLKHDPAEALRAIQEVGDDEG